MKAWIRYEGTTEIITIHSVESVRIAREGLYIKTFGNEEVLHRKVEHFFFTKD